MHFGRVENPTGIDFTLPPDAPRTRAFFELPWHGAGRLHTGCPIWAEKRWVGSFYPRGTKSADYLSVYASRLKAVELNSTFYHLLDAARIGAWVKRVPSGFKFCPKVFRDISENLGSPNLRAMVQKCADGFAAFGETYGLGFIQFPETFAPEYGPLLARFFTLWPRELPLAVEVRHPDWFHQHALRDDLVNLLYRNGAATVVTDTPGRRDVLHTSFSQPRIIVRFQGTNLSPFDGVRLQAWAERLKAWAGRGMEDLYLFCHQPDEALIPETVSLYLQALGDPTHCLISSANRNECESEQY